MIYIDLYGKPLTHPWIHLWKSTHPETVYKLEDCINFECKQAQDVCKLGGYTTERYTNPNTVRELERTKLESSIHLELQYCLITLDNTVTYNRKHTLEEYTSFESIHCLRV